MREVGVPSRKVMKHSHVFFDMQHDATEARLQNWGAFRYSMHFLRFSSWKYPENISRRNATSVRTPILSKIGVRAGGVTHTRTQKLGAFRPCWHIVTVQTRGVGLGLHA